MLFRRSTENEWNISQNFTTARAITLIPWLQRRSYITFFTLVGDISRRQANTREISDIFHFTAIHFLPERHSAMVLIYYIYHAKS